MRRKLAVLLLAIAAICGVGLTGVQSASAQTYDYYDWGWVQGYYGGVHLYMYDYCPYSSAKDTCREMHYDHHVVAWNQVIPDSDNLPEWMWLGAIQPGTASVSGLRLQWNGWGAFAGGEVEWYPSDDSGCPSGQSVCGLYSGGVAVTNAAGNTTYYGGNTAHARFYQNNSNYSGGVHGQYAFTWLY